MVARDISDVEKKGIGESKSVKILNSLDSLDKGKVCKNSEAHLMVETDWTTDGKSGIDLVHEGTAPIFESRDKSSETKIGLPVHTDEGGTLYV